MSERYVVCPRCEGRGSHVNPNVDGRGITADEMAELGPDFQADYLRGVYDVACEECNGLRVVPRCTQVACDKAVLPGTRWVPEVGPLGCDWSDQGYEHCYDHMTDDEAEDWRSDVETDAMYAAERRMGAMSETTTGEGRYRETFASPYAQHADKVGRPFRVLRRITEPDKAHPAEILPMYVIEFEDGAQIEAWPEEVEHGRA